MNTATEIMSMIATEAVENYDRFRREYLCMPWQPTAAEEQLRALAKEYHERTEAYDRTVCTGPIVRGAVMPVTGAERSAINRFAIYLRDHLGIQAAQMGFSRKDWIRAIQDATR
jgi:hypothetical protein